MVKTSIYTTITKYVDRFLIELTTVRVLVRYTKTDPLNGYATEFVAWRDDILVISLFT